MRFLGALLFVAGVCLGSHQAVAQPATVHALVLTNSEAPIDQRVAADLKAEGIELITRPLGEPLNQELLRQFHLVILMDCGGVYGGGLGAPFFHDSKFVADFYTKKHNIEQVQWYVEGGGGLLFCPETVPIEPLLKPWGAAVVRACPRDDAHAWETYSWTDNIIDSPVTKGVKRLYYPTQMARWDDMYPTLTFRLSHPRWKPVVRGMEGSVTARCLQYKTWFPVPGTQDPPILAAIAEVGRGRVALLGINRFYTFTYPYRDVPGGWIGEFQSGNINGVVLKKGDGTHPSDGFTIIRNMIKWAAEPAAAQGLGGYTPDAYAALPVPEKPAIPQWLQPGWRETPGMTWYKVLLGPRSAYSDGKGSITQWAEAARGAGYSILVMTEDLASFPADKWPEYYAECEEASGADLVVLPGLDITDAYGNRLLLFGQRVFPQPWMLTDDGKAMKEIQFLMLGAFNPSFSAIAHPTSSPLPHHLFKFFAGVVVYTYDREGRLIDDGTPAYQAEVYNASTPIPLVVHELDAPEQVAKAAQEGHQLYVPADTVENAAWYLRNGEPHFWENPVRCLVTSGPMLRSLSPTGFTVEDDVPITDVRYYTQYNLLRRWMPRGTQFTSKVSPPPGNLNLGFLWVADEQGRTAISPPLRSGDSGGYNWRCSDRQNFFGVAVNYTGTVLSGGLDIRVPNFGTDEGKGLWPRRNGPRRGENLAPLLEFPYLSPAVRITDALIDQRYWRALWEDVVFDAKPPQGTTRSRVYEGRVRYHDFFYQDFREYTRTQARLMMMVQVDLRLRKPVIPVGDVFPGFANVGASPTVQVLDDEGNPTASKLTEGFADLPVGGCANGFMVLTPGLRVNAEGLMGFAAPQDRWSALPTGTSWSGRVVQVDTDKFDLAEVQRVMIGRTAPYGLELTRGTLNNIAYAAELKADGFGIAGTIHPYEAMPYTLPLCIEGANWNWPAGLWREGAQPDLVYCGVFEGRCWARLDVTEGGRFYAGNILIADNPELRLAIIQWTADGITIEADNPTNEMLQTTVQTPAEITDRYHLNESISVPAGTSLRIHFPK